MAKRAKQSTPNKKKYPEKQPHRFRASLREIRPTWKKNPDFVIPMMEDMLEKKAKLLFDKAIILEFAQRFMEIHKTRIQKIKPEIYETVYAWVFYSRLQTHADIYNWVRKKKYEQKFWLNDQLQLDYLNRQIEQRSENLFVDHPANEKLSRHYDILMCFKEGEFPDMGKYNLVEVGSAIADFEFIEFLEEERDALLKEITKTTVKVPVELKTSDDTQLHELIVQIPPQFFESLGQKRQPDETDTQSFSGSKRIPGPKLYTRK